LHFLKGSKGEGLTIVTVEDISSRSIACVNY